MAGNSSFFYPLLKSLLRFWLEKQFRLEGKVPDAVKELKPPFLVLPNHQGFWDGFMVAMYLDYPVSYVVTDAAFRSPCFKRVLDYFGSIPKTKALSDMDALKNIINAKRSGKVIGIFPESRRTWDGTTLPLLFSVAKLIKLLKIPVVTAIIKGGYFSQPRWGGPIQRGKVVVEYKLLFTADDLKNRKAETIHELLTSAMYHDEFNYQDEVQITYKGRKPAESLEQVLFICPECKSDSSMHSHGNTFSCGNCGYEVIYTPLRKFESRNNKVIFDTIRDWYRWQQNIFITKLTTDLHNKDILLEEKNLIFHSGYKSRKPKYFTAGNMILTKESLLISDKNNDVIQTFTLDRVSGIDAQNKEKLEFYYNNVLYIVSSKNKQFSVNKWLDAFAFLQDR